ncbi:MAG: serine/threonine protein kinase, partial [Deltaproteobacteria bacterium]|nr:serine/threonine protein kinase [Deltaproteobacteria bacterium]
MPAGPSEVGDADAAPIVAPTRALSARFRIDAVLGTGGMGVVVAAHHLVLDQRVALKLMRPELRDRKDLVRRFLREARVAARLKSRHTTRVFDVGVLDDGAPYIVMEYLDGVDAASFLRRHGPVAPARAAGIVLQALDAIAEAHALGVIHRDLKPANLFLIGTEVKVLDLGICKLAGEPADTSHELGTPVYMAPEQRRSPPRSDARSDLWSCGVLLHELVTGAVPGAANAARVPAALAPILARCLADDPADRYQSAAELAAALA